MHTKTWRKGHDEQDLAATSRNIFFFVGGIEINIRGLNYKIEDNNWVLYKRRLAVYVDCQINGIEPRYYKGVQEMKDYNSLEEYVSGEIFSGTENKANLTLAKRRGTSLDEWHEQEHRCQLETYRLLVGGLGTLLRFLKIPKLSQVMT